MNILTIDLEDWFHFLDHAETSLPVQWERYESRVERNMDWILEALSKSSRQATFFCLGWIAQRHPALIKRIAGLGHEIACHSMNHQLVYEQSLHDFREDVISSIHLLEDLSGQKVITYRAPGFSISERTLWAYDILAGAGIRNDCSIFPASRNHGGYTAFPERRPCRIIVNGTEFREFPMSWSAFLGRKIVFSGGGYFRLVPYSVIRPLMRKADYVMTYFHPRDFDPVQPVLSSLPVRRRLMSYTGLKGARKKFEMLLSDFEFVNVCNAVDKIDWNGTAIVSLN